MHRFDRQIRAILVVFWLLTTPAAAVAHPHVWIDVVSDILFDANGRMIGLKHTWTFDESFSVLSLQGLDRNRDGKLSRSELAPLLKRSMASLKEWDYFSYTRVDGRKAPFVEMRRPAMQVKDGRLVLEFELLLRKPVDAGRHDVHFTVYDRSFYNLLSFAEEDPVWLGRNAPDSCSFAIEPAKRGDRETTTVADSYIESLGENVNYGAQFAEWVNLQCDRR